MNVKERLLVGPVRGRSKHRPLTFRIRPVERVHGEDRQSRGAGDAGAVRDDG